MSNKNIRNFNGAIILKAVIIGVVLTLGVMLALSAVMLIFDVSSSLAVPFATVSVAVGSFGAAFYSARKIGSRGYLIGLICGFITFAVVFLLSLAMSMGGITQNTLFHLIIILISSLIGGILGINFKTDKKYI